MLLMGAKLSLDVVTANNTGIGATYRYSGRNMGLATDFSETVTRYVPGRENVWQTIGGPRILFVQSYEMGVRVESLTESQTRLTVTINYALLRSGAGAFSAGCLLHPMRVGASTA